MSLTLGLYLNSQHPENEDPGDHLMAIVEQRWTTVRAL